MLAATVMLAGATPAAAAATVTPATAVAAPAKAAASKPRLICKTESVTGSLMPKKTCYTSDDYAQRQQDQRQNLERMQNNLSLKGN
jgi:3-oxoacyl-ACP reductase-like protein